MNYNTRIRSKDPQLLSEAFATLPELPATFTVLLHHSCARLPMENDDEATERSYLDACSAAKVIPYSGLAMEATSGGLLVPKLAPIYSQVRENNHWQLDDITREIDAGKRFYEREFESKYFTQEGLRKLREERWPSLRDQGYRILSGFFTFHQDYRESTTVHLHDMEEQQQVWLRIRGERPNDVNLALISWYKRNGGQLEHPVNL